MTTISLPEPAIHFTTVTDLHTLVIFKARTGLITTINHRLGSMISRFNKLYSCHIKKLRWFWRNVLLTNSNFLETFPKCTRGQCTSKLVTEKLTNRITGTPEFLDIQLPYYSKQFFVNCNWQIHFHVFIYYPPMVDTSNHLLAVPNNSICPVFY